MNPSPLHPSSKPARNWQADLTEEFGEEIAQELQEASEFFKAEAQDLDFVVEDLIELHLDEDFS